MGKKFAKLPLRRISITPFANGTSTLKQLDFHIDNRKLHLPLKRHSFNTQLVNIQILYTTRRAPYIPLDELHFSSFFPPLTDAKHELYGTAPTIIKSF